jgi:predicted AAA+ superfamily ATPase
LSTFLFPFSFREVIDYAGNNKTDSDKQQLCLEYVKKGGFPEIWVKNYDPIDYLGTLFDSVLLKDIVKRYRVRNPNALLDLAHILIANMTGEFSSTSIQKLANFNSFTTVEKYLGYLEEAFLLFRIPRFSFKVKEQKISGKKIYCYDNGYFKAKAFQFSQNNGKLFENAVAIALKRREMTGNCRLFYFKNSNGEEVDFIVQQGLKITQLIQVCYSFTEPKVKERELRALLKASIELDCQTLIVITHDVEVTEQHSWFGKTGEIEFIPLWKWLLRDPL